MGNFIYRKVNIYRNGLQSITYTDKKRNEEPIMKKVCHEWGERFCTCMPLWLQMLLALLGFIMVCIGIQSMPRLYTENVDVYTTKNDSIIENDYIPEKVGVIDRVGDFIRAPRNHGLVAFKYKIPIILWTDGFPAIWVIYSALAYLTGACWVPAAFHWWCAIAAALTPFVIARTHYYLTVDNEGCFDGRGNVIVVGDSWSVPGDDFKHHAGYVEGY